MNYKKNNIIITSAGKRVELLQEFKHELALLCPDAQVIAVDLNPKMSPACWVADRAFAVPRVTSPDYIPALMRIAEDNNVRLVVPTIDTELKILAQSRPAFLDAGIEVLVPDTCVVDMCRDKRMTARFFDKVGIPNPKVMDKHDPRFPMFAKPYDGSLSANIHVINTSEDLTQRILDDPKLIFMELIDKTVFKEYTVDMYYDADGNVKSIVPRERIEIRAGEVNKGAARKNGLVKFLKERMELIPGIRGCICIQVFYDESSDKVVGIEINPRFGGGYPLSYYAKANFPEMIIREYIMGEYVSYDDSWIDGTVMLRYDSQVIYVDK